MTWQRVNPGMNAISLKIRNGKALLLLSEKLAGGSCLHLIDKADTKPSQAVLVPHAFFAVAGTHVG